MYIAFLLLILVLSSANTNYAVKISIIFFLGAGMVSSESEEIRFDPLEFDMNLEKLFQDDCYDNFIPEMKNVNG